MNEQIIEAAKQYIQDLFNGNSDGHDTDHSLRVYRNALKIAGSYPESDEMIISLSSLLHDVDDHKLFNTTDNANARSFLEKNGIEKTDIEKLAVAKCMCSVSRMPARAKCAKLAWESLEKLP